MSPSRFQCDSLGHHLCERWDIALHENSSDTTAMNPQFHIQIPRSGAAKCHVVVSFRNNYISFVDVTNAALQLFRL